MTTKAPRPAPPGAVKPEPPPAPPPKHYGYQPIIKDGVPADTIEVDALGDPLTCRHDGKEYVMVPREHWDRIQKRLDDHASQEEGRGLIMGTSTLDISEARKQFSQLDKRLREDRVIWITRHNKKAFAVVDTELLQTVLETIEILSEPEGLKMFQEGLHDIRAGRLYDHEDVKSELLNGIKDQDSVDPDSDGLAEKSSA